MPAVRIKDHWKEQRLFDQRAVVGGVVVFALIATLLVRLYFLQVVHHDYYTELSQGNRVRIEPIPAARGLIMDRNGEVIAGSTPTYQLELIPEEVPDLKGTLKRLVDLDLIHAEEVDELIRTIHSRRSFDTVPIRLRMSDEEVARFAVRRFEFPGLDLKTRQTRWYPSGALAVHALGYVGAISEQDLAHIDRAAYAGTALMGKLGVESTYETQLHGTNGSREILVNAQGRSVDRQGAFVPNLKTKAPVAGEDVLPTLDLNVQRIAEAALDTHRGAVVALDPNNGDVIALASMPGFDPNLFGRGITSSEYRTLQEDIDRPLFNRALRGTYPSGSTIKPGMALAGLTYHTIDPEKRFFCTGTFHIPGSAHVYHEFHNESHGSVNLDDAIARSCDTYFYTAAAVLGVDRIDAFLGPLGFGKLTGIDISGEKAGILPSREWKIKTFKNPADQVWFPGETVNLGVGQGYLTVTPLELAHYAGIVGTRGKIWRPRLVSGFRDPVTGQVHKIAPISDGEITTVSDDSWDRVIHGMVGVTTRGTAAAIGAHAPYVFGGKTGTAQVFTVATGQRYNAKTLDERLRDHSWFIAFAPADHPKIAVAVLEENGGSGAGAAAPIARKVLDAYLLGPDQGVNAPPPPPKTPTATKIATPPKSPTAPKPSASPTTVTAPKASGPPT